MVSSTATEDCSSAVMSSLSLNSRILMRLFQRVVQSFTAQIRIIFSTTQLLTRTVLNTTATIQMLALRTFRKQVLMPSLLLAATVHSQAAMTSRERALRLSAFPRQSTTTSQLLIQHLALIQLLLPQPRLSTSLRPQLSHTAELSLLRLWAVMQASLE